MPHIADTSPQGQSQGSHQHRSGRLRDSWSRSGKKADEAKSGRPPFRFRLFTSNCRPTDPGGGGERKRVGSKKPDRILCDISTLCPPPLTPNIYSVYQADNPPRSAPLIWLAEDEGWITGTQSATTHTSYTWSHPPQPSQPTTSTSQALRTAIGDEEGDPDPPPDYVQSQEEARRRSWPCSHPYDYWSAWSTTQHYH
ncbi:MAG: hypothetical protein M1816_000543 [Peltula sp. TS41687]|nr:MAG: hypothetical protein M1816_000543 [Peltula sp. TS41687]